MSSHILLSHILLGVVNVTRMGTLIARKKSSCSKVGKEAMGSSGIVSVDDASRACLSSSTNITMNRNVLFSGICARSVLRRNLLNGCNVHKVLIT